MNKSESKYYNTACLMDEALLQLLEKKDFRYITVKQVCEKAGVNRSTFYLHYETMSDLLNESIEYLCRQLKEKYPDGKSFIIENCSLDELLLFTPEYSVPYLQFIQENKKAFMAAISQPQIFNVNNITNQLFGKLFSPILERYSVPESERRYIINYYMSGIHAIIIEWIKNNCNDEIPFIANLIVKCVNHKAQ